MKRLALLLAACLLVPALAGCGGKTETPPAPETPPAQDSITFERCVMIRSNYGGYFDDTGDYDLFFIQCEFGPNESNYWYWCEGEHCIFTDCQIMSPPEDPDYGD